MQSPYYWEGETEDRNVTEDVDNGRNQVECVLVDTSALGIGFPEPLYRDTLEGEGEEIREKDSARNEGNNHGAHPKTGSPLKHSPVEEEDTNLDGEDADSHINMYTQRSWSRS